MVQFRRRQCLIATAALLVVPLAVAQQGRRTYRVGVLFPGPPASHDELINDESYKALVQGMRDSGYIDGKDFTLDVHHFGTRADELDRAIAALLPRKPDVIVTVGSQSARAAKKATSTIPIVMAVVGDPVGQGLVTSLARPGGNLTGNSILAEETIVKRLDLLHETLPRARRIGVLLNPSNPSYPLLWNRLQSAATRLGLLLLRFDATSPTALDAALEKIAGEHPDAVMMGQDNLFYFGGSKIAEAMARQRIPAIYGFRETVAEGGLMSYANSTKAMFRNAAKFVSRILNGAKPSDLPVEQATTFELVVNLKTAKTLGIKIPQTVLLRADRTIE